MAPRKPVDADEAFISGCVAGSLPLAMTRAGIPATIELIDDEDGNHTTSCYLSVPSGRYLVTVERAR